MKTLKVKAKDFSLVHIPAGQFLFFPALPPRPRVRDEHRELSRDPRQIAVVAMQDGYESLFATVRFGDTLHLQVDQSFFERLARELSEGEANDRRIDVEIELDDENRLTLLRINGMELGPRFRERSEFPPVIDSALKSSGTDRK